MKSKQEIVDNWLPRYTGATLDQFGKYVLLTNFSHYVNMFARMHNVEVIGKDRPMQCATAEGITIINFGMGSPGAATIMDLLTAIQPEAVLFLGKCGGLKKRNKIGDLILPIAAIRGEGTSNDYFPAEVPALPAFALQKAISEKGIPEAIDFCNVEALPILSEVGQKYNISIKRASIDFRNPLDKPTEEELPILDAYSYNSENDIKNEPNIQKFENGEILLYTKAIQIPNGLCLNCHGETKTDINEETLDKIQKLYPEDKAKNHKIGDLRGMWSIRLPKAEVIKRL